MRVTEWASEKALWHRALDTCSCMCGRVKCDVMKIIEKISLTHPFKFCLLAGWNCSETEMERKRSRWCFVVVEEDEEQEEGDKMLDDPLRNIIVSSLFDYECIKLHKTFMSKHVLASNLHHHSNHVIDTQIQTQTQNQKLNRAWIHLKLTLLTRLNVKNSYFYIYLSNFWQNISMRLESDYGWENFNLQQ